MRVVMLVDISGGRGDGTMWPPAGRILICDDAEGNALIKGHLAEPAPPLMEPEKATVPQVAVETRPSPPVAPPVPKETPEPKSPLKPGPSRPRGAKESAK